MSEAPGAGGSQDPRGAAGSFSFAAWRSTLRAEAVLGVAALTYLFFGFVGADGEADPLAHPLRSLLLFGWIFAVLVWASFGVVRHAEALLAAGRPDADSLDTIAAAYAASGDFAAAVQHASRALVLYESGYAPGQPLRSIRQRLDAYRARHAFIDVAD